MTTHAHRKGEHLDLCATDAVAFQSATTLFDEVGLVHDALPEMAVSEIDMGVELCGKRLRAPLVIAAMTGGLDRAERVNRDLAAVAQEHGIAFGFGSMRPMLEHGTTLGYLVRGEAPDALIFGNLGVVQARKASLGQLTDLIGQTGCDALCIHLNPAQEVIQAGGDDDFRGGLDAIAHIVETLPVPVVVKETGCGLSRSVGQRLVAAGVKWVDAGGAGGTSWVGVETLRARAATRTLGERFWDWGIPTAGSVAQLSDMGLGIIATGGVRHGLDVARALALGARAGGMARPFLMAWNEGGRAGASAEVDQVLREIRVAMLLTGSRTVADLATKPLVIGPALERWVVRGSPLRDRLPG